MTTALISPGRVWSFVTLAVLVSAGCASRPSGAQQPPANAIVVEGETVTPTGSRISQTVRKGTPGGVAADMPGVTTAGARDLEREQNDFQSQGMIGRGK